MSSNQYLCTALWHASQGRHVFPVAVDEKAPITAHGLLDATIDPEQIAQWWAEYPAANIGLACRKSGLLVIDIDPDHGGDATFAALERELGALPRTVHQRSGSGGAHIVMKDPSPGDHGWTRTHDAGGSCKGKLGAGVDVKNNGYILVEPSRSSKGPYTWLASDWANVPEVPAAWQAMLQKDIPGPPGAGVEAWRTSGGELSPEDLESLCATLDSCKRGQGQSATFKAIKAIFHDYGRSLSEGEMYLRVWNEESGKPHADDALARQVERVAARDLEHPRGHMLEARRAVAAASVASIVGARPANAAKRAYAATDLGNAQRFVDQHKDGIRYVHAWRKWIIWDGMRWKPDDGGEISRLIHVTVQQMGIDAAALPMDQDGETRRKHAMVWATRSEDASKMAAIERVARDLEPVVISPDKLDVDPWVFNVENGTIDLRTGQLRAHSAGDLITKLSPITYDPNATCPLWDSLQLKVFPSSQGLRDFVKRAVGYTLTGSPEEHCMFILFGKGCNGKSTFIETVRAILGKYGCTTEMSAFIARKGDSGISNEIAALEGVRFATAAETEHGRALAESLIKSVTGGDEIKARKLYQEGREFKAVFKLWLSTNHKPMIRGTDDGIWRRLRLIPFTYSFTDAEKDKRFGEKLKAELPGILRWAIDGVVKWNQQGLGSCAEVDQASAGYRTEMDPIGPFIEDNCTVDPSQSVTGQALYGAYKQWCVENSCNAITDREFRARLDDLGFKKFDKSISGKVRSAYNGIGLLASGSFSQTLFAQQGGDPGKPNISEEVDGSKKNAELPSAEHAEP